MASKPARRRKRYSPVEIQSALTTLAYYGGNSTKAAEATGIESSVLRHWRTKDHAQLYLEIAEREGPKLEAIAAQQAREVILRAGETEHSLLDLLNDRIDNDAPSKELSELAGTLQRVTTTKGINGTKLLELTGRPTQIVEHRDPKQEAQALARRLGVAFEATATELQARPLLTESHDVNARELESAA